MSVRAWLFSVLMSARDGGNAAMVDLSFIGKADALLECFVQLQRRKNFLTCKEQAINIAVRLIGVGMLSVPTSFGTIGLIVGTALLSNWSESLCSVLHMKAHSNFVKLKTLFVQ